MGTGSLVGGNGVWGNAIRTGGDDLNHRMALPSALPDWARCGAFYCWTCRLSCQHYAGLGLARINLVTPSNAICLCQPLHPLDLSEADRVFRSIVDGVEDANAKCRFYRHLHRWLFRSYTLGVGVDAPKEGSGNWINGLVNLGLGHGLA